MTYFLKRGSHFNVSTKASLDLYDALPVGTYTVKFDQMSGQFFLEEIEGFELKGKIYGDTPKTSTRILNTFLDREGGTGVMLSGEKGSGKTLLAKKLSLDAQEMGFPTIVINQPWQGETFNVFIQMIEQPTVIIFDEFEKVYDRDEQESLLTLLDGVYPSKKLFIITCNDKWRVNEHMKNRPGRIFYRIEYEGLEKEFIEEYCQDNLDNKNHIPAVCQVAVMFSQFNFDILKALVEEMNRYGETPQSAMKLLNAKPEHGESERYRVLLSVGGHQITWDDLDETEWRGNPLGGEIRMGYLAPARKGSEDEDDREWKHITFSVSDLKTIDPEDGKFQFVTGHGDKLTLSRVKVSKFDMESLLV